MFGRDERCAERILMCLELMRDVLSWTRDVLVCLEEMNDRCAELALMCLEETREVLSLMSLEMNERCTEFV